MKEGPLEWSAERILSARYPNVECSDEAPDDKLRRVYRRKAQRKKDSDSEFYEQEKVAGSGGM